MNKIYIYIFTMLIACTFGLVSCTDNDGLETGHYGYVQFKLYKTASDSKQATSATRAVEKLEYLVDARKIKVLLKYDGNTIAQTMVLNSYNAENAEYGLRSDKLRLLAGKYTFIGYTLYDKFDNELLSKDVTDCVIEVVQSGLVVQDVYTDVVERGLASFKLVKSWQQAATRAVKEGEEYPFNNIKCVDITVQNTFTKETVTIKKIRVNYVEDFADNATPGKNQEISYALCDTVVWLKAGTYRVKNCVTYSDKNGKSYLATEYNTTSETFDIYDNKLEKEINVPVNLSETDEYIKDYIALKDIWEALGGEEWSYAGDVEAQGANWNFNKDIDMWGEQPGVGLNANGRVETISLEGFGPKGIVPDAIGQLTELKVLYLASHSDLLGGHLFGNVNSEMTEADKMSIRMDYAEKVLKKDFRLGLSEMWQKTIEVDNTQQPLKKGISLKGIHFGDMTNGIEGISKAIMRCTKLEQFFIANSPITSDGFFREIGEDSPYYVEKDDLSWENMTNLLDLEIFNCPKLVSLPMDMLANLPELQMLNISSCKGISAEQLKTDWETFINGKSGEKIQVIYMGFNNLKEFPAESELKKMVKLGMIDCTNNQIEVLHPFGKNINLAEVYLDYNKIKKIPVSSEDGYFCGYSQLESFSASHNEMTEFPDIFNAKSAYEFKSINFSYNKIAGFENGDAFKGVNASQVNLSDNHLKTFPGVLFKTGSPISYLVLAGNGMEKIPAGSLKGSNAWMLEALDLSYNYLSKLPDDFYSTTLPYLSGLDLSFNSFSEFPVKPLDISRLQRLFVRYQRDKDGNRILKEWPTGIYQCPSMSFLCLGGNDLRKIDDTISPNIFYLEIADNPNISIDLSSVCDYIRLGYYMLVYDVTQDIRGCDALDLER